MSHLEDEFSQLENERGWNLLFQKIPHQDEQLKFDAALSVVNRSLNRFRDVLPYDHTRVKLKQGLTDYINANFVQIPTINRKYILTQGPLPTTSNHFWQMVWEQNSRVIVMLTRLIEKGCSKCWLYYPDQKNSNEFIFNDVDLKVIFLSIREYRHYTQRKFLLKKLSTSESRTIIHWSEFDWPDHGAPNNPEPFLQLLCDVRHCGAFDCHYGAPILHCSAGIGRSGTFVLVDSILKMFANSSNPSEISLIDVLKYIRTQRSGLVQTVEQLRFSYLAVIAGFKMLNQIEQSEHLFSEDHSDLSGESDEETNCNDPSHPKTCGRQNNVMPNGRLPENLDEINCDLIKRADSIISNYQPSPKYTQRTFSQADLRFLAGDSSYQPTPNMTPRGSQSSLILRKRSIGADSTKDLNISTEHSSSSPLIDSSNNTSSTIDQWIRKPRQSLLIGVLIFLTGSILLYRFAFTSNRNH